LPEAKAKRGPEKEQRLERFENAILHGSVLKFDGFRRLFPVGHFENLPNSEQQTGGKGKFGEKEKFHV
jgi:hypothetical protein